MQLNLRTLKEVHLHNRSVLECEKQINLKSAKIIDNLDNSYKRYLYEEIMTYNILKNRICSQQKRIYGEPTQVPEIPSVVEK